MGAQKRKLKLVADAIRTAFPVMDTDQCGIIYSGGAEAARYDLTSEQWQQRAAWAGVGVRWEQFLATASA